MGQVEEVREEDPKAFFGYLKAEKVTALIILYNMVEDTKDLIGSANGSDEDKVMDSFTLGALEEDFELLKDIIIDANVHEVNDLLANIPDLDKILVDTAKELAEIYSDIRAGKPLGALWSRLVNLHGDIHVSLDAFIKDLMEEIKELRAELQKVQVNAAQGSSA